MSDNFLTNLKNIFEKKGFRGCWEYWIYTLNEEVSDFTMELDEEAGEFKITMHYCPSKGRLLGTEHIEPYHDYCLHCDILYCRIIEPLGFKYIFDFSQFDNAIGSLIFLKKAIGHPR